MKDKAEYGGIPVKEEKEILINKMIFEQFSEVREQAMWLSGERIFHTMWIAFVQSLEVECSKELGGIPWIPVSLNQSGQEKKR